MSTYILWCKYYTVHVHIMV